jgi:VanZ family protein
VRWRRAGRALPALLWAAGIRLLSSMPDPPGGSLADVPHLDKLAHAGLFGVLAALLRLAGLPPVWAVTTAGAWGVLDEAFQAGVPGRDPSAADVAADLVGAVLAVIAVRWLARRRWGARYRGDRNGGPTS